MASPEEVDRMLRPLQLKDLRAICRARGLNPAGGKDELAANLKQHMFATGNFNLSAPPGGADGAPVMASPGMNQFMPGGPTGVNNNNYARPGGQQNVGNFITDRPSSRVLAPPGGASQISFGSYGAPQPQPTGSPYQAPPAPYGQVPQQQPGYGQAPPGYGQGYGQDPRSMYQPPQQQPGYSPDRPVTAGAKSMQVREGPLSNNYSRPGGQQNVGNFITDRPSSKVLAPPGGKSQISFG